MADLKPLDLKLMTLSHVPKSSDPATTLPQSLTQFTTTTIGFICTTITKYYSIAKALAT